MSVFHLALFWLFFGCLGAFLAQKRGRNPLLWFGVGLFLGLLGALTVILLPKPRVQPPPIAPPVKTPPPQKMWYYLDNNHTPQGPLTLSQLPSQELLVWSEGMENWIQASSIPKEIA